MRAALTPDVTGKAELFGLLQSALLLPPAMVLIVCSVLLGSKMAPSFNYQLTKCTHVLMFGMPLLRSTPSFSYQLIKRTDVCVHVCLLPVLMFDMPLLCSIPSPGGLFSVEAFTGYGGMWLDFIFFY